jgi:hypothetical protein
LFICFFFAAQFHWYYGLRGNFRGKFEFIGFWCVFDRTLSISPSSCISPSILSKQQFIGLVFLSTTPPHQTAGHEPKTGRYCVSNDQKSVFVCLYWSQRIRNEWSERNKKKECSKHIGIFMARIDNKMYKYQCLHGRKIYEIITKTVIQYSYMASIINLDTFLCIVVVFCYLYFLKKIEQTHLA